MLQKRKRDREAQREVPEDVYIQHAESQAGDTRTVRTSASKAQSIKLALSRTGSSIKSKFSRKSAKSGNNGETVFEDESIATNEEDAYGAF